MKLTSKGIILTLLLFFYISKVFSQGIDSGFPYQMQLTSQNGGFIVNSPISVKINIRNSSLTGTIYWQEEHTLTTNDFGHVEFIIGDGVPTGSGSIAIFNEIPWKNDIYFLEVLLDEQNNGSFISLINSQILAVPFAFHSRTTEQTFKLSELIDVDTTGIEIGDVLKWNGTEWTPGTDNFTSTLLDTVSFSVQANHSIYSDTAIYALNCEVIQPIDSAIFSYYADSSNYADSALFSNFSNHSVYSDTATISLYSVGNWGLDGNTIDPTNFLGTIDSTDLIFKTNNTEKMRIKANGRIGIGTSTPITDFHINSNNGIVFTGNFGQGTIPIQGAGTRLMWYPAKGAFRAGTVTGTTWNDSKIGDYSFATGYNTKADGDYSAAFGFGTAATGDYSFASGHNSYSTGNYSFSTGENARARAPYSIAMGRGAETFSQDTAAIALGYHPNANGKFSVAIGNYTKANQPHSYAFGYKSVANHSGSFIYSDNSTNGYTYTTAANQFMVKASGGTIFYTNSTLTTGVMLPAGGGAWSSLSDKHAKENFEEVDKSYYLSILDSVPVTKWNYLAQHKKIKHIGPMAQDFYKFFKIGDDSTKINSIDFDGINLLLLQAINERTIDFENQNVKLKNLEEELKNMTSKRKELETLIYQLEKKYTSSNKD